ncbi:MAG TPA: hypothetical protein VI451_20355 [Anaerolineales bacterium]|nr:hypothetical protein [Anaerolineales bacterium]
MATKTWETVKTVYCLRIQQEVTLEALVVYPPEHMPDGPPQVLGHRCSEGLMCNTLDKPACVWAGTNPIYNPFSNEVTHPFE